MVFNIVLHAVLGAELAEVCGPHEVQHGLGWETGEQNLVFRVDDVWTAERGHIWMQDTLTVTVAMFKRVVLETNLENTKLMV